MDPPPLKKACLTTPSSRHGQCFLISLPSELLVVILSFLCARDKFYVSLTCHHLYFRLSDPIFWRNVFWRDYFPPREEKALKYVMHLGVSSLTKLSIFSCGTVALSRFRSVIESCSCLESITMIGFTLSQSQVAALLLSVSAKYLEIEIAEKECKQIVEILAASQLTSVVLHFGRAPNIAMLAKAWSNAGYFPSDVTLRCRYVSVDDVQFALVKVLDTLQPCNDKARLAVGYSSIHTHIKQATMQPFCEIVGDKVGFKISRVGCNELGLTTHMLSLTQNDITSRSYSAAYIIHNTSVRQLLPSQGIPQDITLLENITELYLANLQELSSYHLTLIADSCCHLVRLNIQKCTKALLDLSGLSNIISRCYNLSGVNFDCIHHNEVECVIKLWEVLSTSKHLSHLRFCSCMVCVSKMAPQCATSDRVHSRTSRIVQQARDVEVIQASIGKLTTVDTLELTCHVPRIQDDHTTFQVLSCFQQVHHLQLEGSPHQMDVLNQIFPLLRLSSIRIATGTRQLLKIPSDPACFQSLQKVAIIAPLFPKAIVINQRITSALTAAKKLTHIYIAACFDSPQAITTLVSESPRLMDFCLTSKMVSASITSQSSLKKLEKAVKCELSRKKVRHQVTLYVHAWPTNVSHSISVALHLTELSSAWISQDWQ